MPSLKLIINIDYFIIIDENRRADLLLKYLQISTDCRQCSLRSPDILDLDTFDHDAPGLSAFVQNRLKGDEIVKLLN